MKTVIFDLDGTLADLTHRLHHVKNGNRRWDQFFDECDKDVPIQTIIDLYHNLDASGDYFLVIVSGRSEVVFEKTIQWLKSQGIEHPKLFMRKAGDYRKDFIIKSEICDQLIAQGHDIAFVIDDRPSVVKMWRERGLTCLQCADHNEELGTIKANQPKGLLTLMIGPSGAGKSTWLANYYNQMSVNGIHSSHVVSSDQLRADLCGGNFKDQSKNEQVFAALHVIVKTRIDNGLPCVIDATNIKRADRMKAVELAAGGPVRYIVINRPMSEKIKDGGWRNEVGFDLLGKHEATFKSQLKDILAGDNLPNVTVIDVRSGV